MNLLRLPDEILLMIFSNLPVTDQEQASQTCKRLKILLCDQRFYRIVNLSGQYSCTKELFKCIMKPRHKYIIHLDLTSCYWLTSSDIYRCVSKMEKLQSLYAVDTQLNMVHLAQLVQRLRHLRRLSFTFSSERLEIIDPSILSHLEFLYIYLANWGNNVRTLLSFIQKCINLKELWILSHYLEDETRSNFDASCEFNFPELESLVINVLEISANIDNSLRDIVSGALSSDCLRCLWLKFHKPFAKGLPIEDQLRGVEYLYPFPSIASIPTQNLKMVCNDMSTVVNFATSEYPSLTHLHLRLNSNLGRPKVEPTVLSGLESLMCTLPCCWTYLKIVTESLSPNNKLRKVTLKCYHDEDASEDQREHIDDFFLALSKYCPQITEIEIIGCYISGSPHCCCHRDMSEFGKFKKLRKLVLQNMYIKDAKFLIKIALNCEKLESISLNHVGLQGLCVFLPDICIALKHCKYLKDFRIEHPNLGKIDTLLEHLKLCPHLERVLISSYRNKIKPSETKFVDLISKCSHLVLLLCAMPSITHMQEKIVNKIVRERFLEDRPALIAKFTQHLCSEIVHGVTHLAEMICPQYALGLAETSVHITGLPRKLALTV